MPNVPQAENIATPITGLAAGSFHQIVKPPPGPIGGGGGPATPVPVAVVLQQGTTGTAYSETITAQGGSGTGYVFSISSGSLPTSLSMSSGGLISGTPTVAGTYTFTVQVVDSLGSSGTQNFSITINAPSVSASNYGFIS